jgi:hypothetical protein
MTIYTDLGAFYKKKSRIFSLNGGRKARGYQSIESLGIVRFAFSLPDIIF